MRLTANLLLCSSGALRAASKRTRKLLQQGRYASANKAQERLKAERMQAATYPILFNSAPIVAFDRTLGNGGL